MRPRWLLGLVLVVACDATGRGGAPAAGAALCAPALPAVPFEYSDADQPLPRHLLSSTAGTVAFSDNTPSHNLGTNAGVTLGRVLFHDVRVSVTDDVSCASCHQQELGFGDTLRVSLGIHGRPTRRRTLALANARFNADGRFFWDQRAASLESQVLQPIQDTTEMGMQLADLERKLARQPFYPPLFAAAFGSPDVTRERIALSLAQFVRSLVSSGSRYDEIFATGGAPDDSSLTDQEREGLRVFTRSGCTGCHRTVVQFADQAANNGLDLVASDPGAGRGRFKPASLRNVGVRPPYMHDGRFGTLRGVVEFYDREVSDGPYLDPRLRASDGSPKRLGLSRGEVDAVVAFLETLTDTSFLHAERFSDPFPCRAERRDRGGTSSPRSMPGSTFQGG